MTNDLFFVPWIGEAYRRQTILLDRGGVPDDGRAYRYHVLGESHYGNSDEYNPGFTRSVIENCAFEASLQGRFFAKVLQVVTGRPVAELDREREWSRLCFSNFVQDFLPGPRIAPTKEMWERGRRAFSSQLALTRAPVLIVLGKRLWLQLPYEGGTRLPQLESFKSNLVVDDAWLYEYKIGSGSGHSLAISIPHPSGRGFDWRVAAERVKIALMNFSLHVSERGK